MTPTVWTEFVLFLVILALSAVAAFRRSPAPFTDGAEARAAALELREEVEREIAASEEHHAKVQALLDGAYAVLVDAEDGGTPTGDHLRALWRAYMELGNPEVLAEMDAVEGGGAAVPRGSR